MTPLAQMTHSKLSPMWTYICGTLGRSESVFIACSLRYQKSHALSSEGSWMMCRQYKPFKRHDMAASSFIHYPTTKYSNGFYEILSGGEKGKMVKHPSTFFFSSYFIILSFLFLIFQSTWLQNRASRLDLTMPWLSWGSKLHWAQNKCAWKLHILNWWLHKIRNRGNADTFGLELGRAVKECGAVVANSSFCDLKGNGL